MSISMYQASVSTFVYMLHGLSEILDKAAAHASARKIDAGVFLSARLYPDMFPFSRQVQLSTDFAKNATARLAGVEAPKFADTEASFDELKQRVAKTLEFLKSVKPAQIDGTEEKDITYPIAGKPVTFKGQQYLLESAMPNFYFHVTTAYAILRHNGVELGKRDFVSVLKPLLPG